jgi:16S rRNA (cytosine1402-N4)-methyltransferase
MSGHIPVLLDEVLDALAPQSGQTIVDGTFGGGGYTRAILAAADCKVIGLDRDPEAIARGKALEAEMGDRFCIIETDFSALDDIEEPIDAIVLDIGVSSFQIDQPERGFSFSSDGPLDMRMASAGPSAADAIAHLSEADLAQVFRVYGEEREARRVARAIVNDRQTTPFLTTAPLAGLVSRVVGRPKHKDAIHPATRVFQALRIFVNDELGELERALVAAEACLPPGGRLVVVTFHSLEDRVVKTFFNARSRQEAGSRHAPVASGPAPTFEILTKKPVGPSEAEIAANPRARSAKLRAAIRTTAPVRGAISSDFAGMPGLEPLWRQS